MDQQEYFRKTALFRFALIAPAVTSTFEAPSVAGYFRNAAARPHAGPDGKPVTVSAYSLERWYYAYKRSGIEGITPKARADSGAPRALSEGATEQIRAIKEKFPYITGKAIYRKLIGSGHINAKSTSLATVHRFIRSNGLKSPAPGAVAVKAFEMEFANDCWQADTSRGPVIMIDGVKRQTFLISFIDDASRLLAHTQFYLNDNAVNMQDSLKQAIAKCGIHKKLFVDNGGPYDNLQLRWICASLGIVLIHARPYSGSSKGKVERSFRTIKDGWMNATDWNGFSSLEEARASLADFLSKEYTNSKHGSLDCSPKERFLRDAQRIRYIPAEELEVCFFHRKDCRVTNAATIKFSGMEYETPQKYIGAKIHIRYLPTDLSKLYIFSDDGKPLHTIYPVRKIDNSKIKRAYIDYSKEGGDF